jgi:hypothetical protein
MIVDGKIVIKIMIYCILTDSNAYSSSVKYNIARLHGAGNLFYIFYPCINHSITCQASYAQYSQKWIRVMTCDGNLSCSHPAHGG